MSRRTRVLVAPAALLLAAAVLQTPAAHAATGTDFYVSATGSDANAGTSSSAPWRSLAAVNGHTFQPGDRILFEAGDSWTGQLALHGSGSAGAPIVVTSYGNGTKPVIAGGGTVTSAVLISNEHDITIDGLAVTNTGGAAAWRNGVEIAAHDAGALPGITVQNNDIHDVDGVAGGVNIGKGGILVDITGNATPTYFTGMRLENNQIQNVGAYGIVTWSTWMQRDGWNSLWSEIGLPANSYGPFTPSTGLVISGNTVSNIGNGGISPNQVADAVVEHNTVANTAMQHGNAGIWWSGTNHMTVQYNDVSGTHYNGQYQDDTAFDSDASTYDSVVQYNFSHGNAGGFFMTCSAFSAPTDATVRYNVSQNDYGDLIYVPCSNAKNVHIYNNTLYATQSPSGSPLTSMVHVYSSSSSNSGFVINDNVFYNPLNKPYDTSSQFTYFQNMYAGGTAPSDPAAVAGSPNFTAPGTATSINDLAGYIPAAGSALIGKDVRIPGDGGRDVRNIPLPTSGSDVGALQTSTAPALAEAATVWPASVTSSYATGAGQPSNVADGVATSSWASPSSVTYPGTLTVDYHAPQSVSAVSIAEAFGQGQGVTNVDVQSWDGSAWVTKVAGAALTWSTNTSSVETRTINLPAAVTTSQLRLVVNAANHTWGNFAIYEFGPTTATGSTNQAPTATSSYATGQGQLSNLVDGVLSTSWASPSSGVTYPGTISVDYHAARTVGAVSISVAFGQGQGVTNLDVQTWNGTAWVTQVAGAALTWSTNTSSVETRTITLPASVSTSQVRLVVNAANHTWGNFAVNEIAVQ